MNPADYQEEFPGTITTTSTGGTISFHQVANDYVYTSASSSTELESIIASLDAAISNTDSITSQVGDSAHSLQSFEVDYEDTKLEKGDGYIPQLKRLVQKLEEVNYFLNAYSTQLNKIL